MRIQRNSPILILAAATLLLALLAPGDGAVAQKYNSHDAGPVYGKPASTYSDARHKDVGGPGIISIIPKLLPPPGTKFIDSRRVGKRLRKSHQSRRSAARRRSTGVPPANERRLVPDEVVVELSSAAGPQQIATLQRRYSLALLETYTSQLSGTMLSRWRISDRRSISTVVQALESDNTVSSAQPNYLYSLQQANGRPEGDPLQYELAKLRLPQAHALTKGKGIVVAVVDSGVDVSHPELAGSIAGAFDANGMPGPLEKHGTSIAGLIAAHVTLSSAAPSARILSVRVFGPTGNGSTFIVLKGLDVAVKNGARVINMSFTGPADPITSLSLQAAYKRGVVLVAAAGNAGPKSPPLYPGAYPEVIAVSGTDANDRSSVFSNRGKYIAVAAPATDIMVAIPEGRFEIASGTSFSAAEVSGIVALMLERRPDLSPEAVRRILDTTAKDIGPKGHDVMFGAGLVDAYRAIMSEQVPLAATEHPVARVRRIRAH